MILFSLDRSSGKPLYLQIVEQVRRIIDEGTLSAGASLPSSRALAARLGVNRSTVFRAYEELWALGYLESRPGSYTRVRNRAGIAKADDRASPGLAWDEIATPPGKKLYQRFLSYTPERAGGPENGLISLSRLELDPRLFPVADLRRCCNRVLSRQGAQVLGYGDRQGDPGLREYIAERARTHGMDVTPQEVLVSNGSQQAIDLVLRVLTGPGQKVALEEPTYANVIPLVQYHQLGVEGISMGAEGLDLEHLERVVETRDPALLYTIPNFQNPTGITTSQNHREALLALCERHRLPLVEDGFEEEMKYFGKVALPIKSMDSKRVVVYLGTFSKVLFPGLRVGFIIADSECVERLTAVKRFTDLSTSAFVQAVLDDFCRQGHYGRHIRRMHRVFRKRMSTALEAVREHLPRAEVRWTEPSGGYLIWVSFNTLGGDEKRFQELCSEHGVAVSPGSYYFARAASQQHFRISISMLDEDQIRAGVARLGQAIRAFATTRGGLA